MSQEQQQQPDRHDETVAEVFGLVVEQSANFTSLRDMCSLLLVSATVRQQLLRVQGHVTWQCLELSTLPSDEHREWTWQGKWLADFMSWLPRHAGLMDSFSASSCDGSSPADMQLLQQWAALALQLARTSAVAAAAHKAAAATADAPSPLALRLTSVTVTVEHAGGELTKPLLQELAFTHTRTLVLENVSLGPANKYASLLGRLTELQELDCDVLEPPAVLTLPVSLRRLVASFVPQGSTASGGSNGSSSGSNSSSCLLDVRHLTQLHTLVCKLHPDLPDAEHKVIDGLRATLAGPRRLEAQLPAQLRRLTALAPLHLGTDSESLKYVALSPVNMQLLPDLSWLPGPWALHLHAHTWEVHTAWQEMEQAVAAIGAAKGLTSLDVTGFYPPSDLPGVQWCPALLALPRLCSLELSGVHLQRHDLLRMTGLTQLSSLCLDDVDPVDDAVAVQLANSLTGLTSLQLRSSRITNTLGTLFAVVGSWLTGLRVLSILGGPGFRAGSLALGSLLALTKLTHLALSPLTCGDECVRHFLVCIPGLSQVSNELHDDEGSCTSIEAY